MLLHWLQPQGVDYMGPALSLCGFEDGCHRLVLPLGPRWRYLGLHGCSWVLSSVFPRCVHPVCHLGRAEEGNPARGAALAAAGESEWLLGDPRAREAAGAGEPGAVSSLGGSRDCGMWHLGSGGAFLLPEHPQPEFPLPPSPARRAKCMKMSEMQGNNTTWKDPVELGVVSPHFSGGLVPWSAGAWARFCYRSVEAFEFVGDQWVQGAIPLLLHPQ